MNTCGVKANKIIHQILFSDNKNNCLTFNIIFLFLNDILCYYLFFSIYLIVIISKINNKKFKNRMLAFYLFLNRLFVIYAIFCIVCLHNLLTEKQLYHHNKSVFKIKKVYIMRLDGYSLFVKDMAKMIRFYRDVLGFEIKEDENTDNVYLLKDGTVFLLYGRDSFEKLTSRRYEYLKEINAHSEMALYIDTYDEVDIQYKNAIQHGATSY